MNIIDTTEKILQLSRQCDCKFVLENWRTYANSIKVGLADILENDASSYDFNDVVYHTERTLRSTERLTQLSATLKAATTDAEKSLATLSMDEFAKSVEVILYLGMCNGAGWATKLDGKNVILLGVEKIFELDWDKKERLQTLICHEIAHCWQSIKVPNLYAKDGITPKEAAVLQLYTEGVAMYVEKIAGDGKISFNQDKGGWLNFCQTNKKELFEAFGQMAEMGDISSFFGDWERYKGFGDVGYFLGYDIVSRIVKSVGFEKGATLSKEKVMQVFDRYMLSLK